MLKTDPSVTSTSMLNTKSEHRVLEDPDNPSSEDYRGQFDGLGSGAKDQERSQT